MVSKTYSDNEKNKFRDVPDGVAIATTTLDAGNLLEGITFDYIGASYPTGTEEVYEYRNGGSGGTLEATITVTYTDSTKVLISSVERS